MRYTDSVPQCGEFLRLTIPFLGKYQLPAHPLNYAIGYEIVSAKNADLIAAFDALQNSGTPLSASHSQQLYDAHIGQPDGEQVIQITDEITHVLDDSQKLLGEISDQSGKYQNTLEQEAPKLESCSNSEDLKIIISTLIADTDSLRQANQAITLSLAEHLIQIGDLRKQLKTSNAAAKIDALTGLNNRGAFDDQLQTCIEESRAAGEPLSLIMVDIDHFKKINDTMGHLVGDKVIKAVGQSILKQIRGKDISARIGGEEFAVILPNTATAGAEVVAENIRKAVEAIMLRKTNDSKKITTVTLSGGIALLQDSDTAESFYRHTDEALYTAKQGGRNQIAFSKAA